MPTADLCTEEEIVQLVNCFCENVRKGEVLGPIFSQHVKDWVTHLSTMVDFWSSTLRDGSRFRGAPMPKHRALPGLSFDLFECWLMLFRQTTGVLPNAALGQRTSELARRIAQSLWHGYQTSQDAHKLVGAA
ncbi:MAG: group III truncated hemoglobin [Rhodoferax sp.]